MDERFSLSTSNKIFFGVVVAGCSAFFLAFLPKTPQHLGTLSGQLVGYFLFPVAVAWVIWRLAGKSPRAGSIAFNIVLGLSVFGQLAAAGRNVQRQAVMREMEERQRTLKQQIGANNDPQAVAESLNQYVDSMRGDMDRLAGSGTGPEKQFFQLMKEFMDESQVVTNQWNKAFDAVQSAGVLNYADLNRPSDYQDRRIVVNAYLTQTKTYRDMFMGMIPRLESKLQALGPGNELAIGALRGAKEKHELQRQVFEPLMAAHLEYGQGMLDLLDALEKNADKWSVRDDKLEIEDETFGLAFQKLVDRFVVCEAKLNELAAKVVDVL